MKFLKSASALLVAALAGCGTLSVPGTPETATSLNGFRATHGLQPLTIDAAPLAQNVTINAQQQSRIFNITAFGGDFTLATTDCGAENFNGTQLVYPGSEPDPGDGRWYLVRAVTSGVNQSYDEPGTTQVGLRDAEIDAAPAACN